MERIIFHIDVNNAFLSWTAVDLLKSGYKEDIRNIVSIIGGDESTRNGIVLAKSIPAKMLGIKTANTIYSARKIYPKLKVFPPNHKLYEEKSRELFNLLSSYSPDIEVASIDECYLDYGKVKNMYGDEIKFAYMLKDKIKNDLGFTVNIGIANNKLCAKMASDFSKPDKVHTLYQNEIEEKMWPLPIDELFGIGKQTSTKLGNLGIKTIKDLALFNYNTLYKEFKNQAKGMQESANGINKDEVNSLYSEPKGISNEITLSKDETDIEELSKYLLLLSDSVSKRLRNEKKYTNTICVIIKDNTFVRKTHQRTLKNPTNLTNEIYNISIEILKEFYKKERVRLIGLRLDNLSIKDEHQISIFETPEVIRKEEELDKIIDEINNKLGKNVVIKASLIQNKKDI